MILSVTAWNCHRVRFGTICQVMYKAFEIAGYPNSVVDERFPAMINAFRFGAPPHGGIAPGIDRIVMLIADEPNIREVILFPMNGKAEDLMMAAPSQVIEPALTRIAYQGGYANRVGAVRLARLGVTAHEARKTAPNRITAPA